MAKFHSQFCYLLHKASFLSTVSMGFMQSCPSHEVGSTARNQIRQRENPGEGRVYLNMNEVAVCSGTVYSWRYCFGPDNSDPPYALVLAMYRPQQNGAYQLVPGSYYQLTVDEKPDPFLCRSTTLEPSEYFTVQENDVVAFCEPLDTSRVEVFFNRRGRRNSLQFWNAGECSESQIMSSPLQLSDIDERVFLLSALIGKSDKVRCYLTVHTCICTLMPFKKPILVGGVNSDYNTGLTGNGTFCEGNNHPPGSVDRSLISQCLWPTTDRKCISVLASHECDSLHCFTPKHSYSKCL